MNTPKFLRITDITIPDGIARGAQRYRLDSAEDCKVCVRAIWFTAFFDGTGNNFFQDGNKNTNPEKTNYSNIAKLWQFAHQNVVTSERDSRTKTSYIAGVGTPVKNEYVNDSGEGNDLALGMAAAAKGLDRIKWMLRELEDHVCLHLQWTSQINVAIFGFSRGATQARAFARMLGDGKLARVEDSKLYWVNPNKDGRRPPVVIYFMGIMDTVASVGYGGSRFETIVRHAAGPVVKMMGGPIAGTIIGNTLDGILGAIDAGGHAEWADDLRIPAYVERCVHLVAAHEVREKFPLDSVREDQRMPANCIEECYPGMHSDIGGGYKRSEQEGRTNELANITLARMYIEAWKAGVPLKSAATINASPAADLFAISPQLEQFWTTYMSLSEHGDRLETQVISHMNLYYQWRAGRLRRLRNGGLNHAYVDPYMAITDKEWQEDVDILQRELRGDPALKIYPNEAAMRNAETGDWLNKLPEETRRRFNLLFDHYVHDSIAGFKKQMKEGKVADAEQSRWSVNRKIFIGKRNKRFLYWRYEGWNPEYEKAKLAFEQQEAQEAALAQANTPVPIRRTA